MFDGFPTTTTDFLRGLAANNDKAWFEAHRADYQAGYVQPALAFIDAMGPRLAAEVSPRVQWDAKVNGSLFRINRDVRFSRDKTPYKAHLDLWFWEGERRGWDAAGYFFRLTPDALMMGCGMHQFSPQRLAVYRTAVLGAAGEELEAVLAAVEKAGYAAGGGERKTLPRGFDASHPRAALLFKEGLTAELETAHPAELGSATFVDWCIGHFGRMRPVSEWLWRSVLSSS